MPSTDQIPIAPGLTEAEREFVHKIAEHYRDTDNMAWDHGYLIGWLMISDPIEQRASELQQALGVSRDAIDHISRILVEPGVLDRSEMPDGDYKLSLGHDAWPKLLRQSLVSMPSFHAVMVDGLEMLAQEPEQRLRRIANMERFYRYLGTEIPAIFDRYQEPADPARQ
jgi:hypothetical protein